MDLYMPGLNGIETTQQILASTPQATVVILTVNEGDDTIAEALEQEPKVSLIKICVLKK